MRSEGGRSAARIVPRADSAKGAAEGAKDFKRPRPGGAVLGLVDAHRGSLSRGRLRRLRGWTQLQLGQGEILLEAVELEKVGELEAADVAASGPDLALEVADQA